LCIQNLSITIATIKTTPQKTKIHLYLELFPRFQSHESSLIGTTRIFKRLVRFPIDASTLVGRILSIQRIAQFELSQTKPHLDVICLIQQPLIQHATLFVLLLLELEVNVRFPNDLGHVQNGLLNAEFVDGACTLDIAQYRLQLGEFYPCRAVLRVVFEILLVELATSIEFAQLDLKLDVTFEQFVLWTHSYRLTLIF
jgi:hypothetical protein